MISLPSWLGGEKEGYEASASVGAKLTRNGRDQDPSSKLSNEISQRVGRHAQRDSEETLSQRDQAAYAQTMSEQPENQLGSEKSKGMENAMAQLRFAQQQSGKDLLQAIQVKEGDIGTHQLCTFNAATIYNNMGGKQQEEPAHSH